MNTRRTFLKTAATSVAAGAMMGWKSIASAARATTLIGREAKIIRVRDRKDGKIDSYLEIASESGLKGYAGPLLKEQVAAFPANLRELLVRHDVADPAQINFATLWSACHPGKTLESYAEGKDPLTGAAVWGVQRKTRQTETGWVITALSAMDLALWDLRGKAAGQPVWHLLGAKRQRLNAYASMLGYSVKPAEARKVATDWGRRWTRRDWKGCKFDETHYLAAASEDGSGPLVRAPGGKGGRDVRLPHLPSRPATVRFELRLELAAQWPETLGTEGSGDYVAVDHHRLGADKKWQPLPVGIRNNQV